MDIHKYQMEFIMKSRYLILLLLAAMMVFGACSKNKTKTPVVIPPTPMELATAAADSASEAFDSEDYALALTQFTLARDLYLQVAPTAAPTDSIEVRIEKTHINIAVTNMRLANEYIDVSMYDDALIEYEQAAEIYKSLTPLTISAEERDDYVKIIYRNLASTAETAQKYEEALVYYDGYLAYDAGNEEVLNRKYFILKDNIKDLDRAITVLKDYAEASQSSNAYQILAKAYKDKGDTASAALYYDRALELSPTVDVFNRVADFYRETGNYLKSNTILEQYIATNPGNEALAITYRVMAGNYDKLKNNAKKIEYYEKSLTVEPNADVALLLANHYNGLKNWDKVINFATQAINKDSSKAVAFLLRGAAYYQKKNNAAAKADLLRIQNDPTYGAKAKELLKAIK